MSSSNPLLSRVANSLYWTGRYIERADNVARFIGVNLQMMLDLPENAGQWQALIDTSGDHVGFRDRYGTATAERVIQFLVFDRENPNAIVVCVNAARENARSVRDTISSEMWEQVNSLYLLINSTRPDSLMGGGLAEFFHRVRTESHLFQGLAGSTMSHNEAWNFLQLGTALERADKTTRILDVKYFLLLPSVDDVGTPYDDIQWSAVLKSVSGFEMYRKRYGRIVPNRVMEFLLMDREFPRAVHHCINTADECLHAITGTPSGRFSCASEQRLGLLRSELHYTRADSILASGLHEFLDALQGKMNRIDTAILEDFFAMRHDAHTAAESAGSPLR